VTSFLYDFRHAIRTLKRYPGFCAVVVLTLGLGIGINTATFTVVNAALFRPLGFPEPERLVALHEVFPRAGSESRPFSPPDFLDVQRDQRSFTGIAAYMNVPFELAGSSAPIRIDAAKVSANLFAILDVAPVLGRGFTADDDRPGVDVAVLSWRLWQTVLQGDPSIVGRTVTLDRRPYTVVGVMPATFEFPRRGPQANSRPASIWVPMGFTPQQLQVRGNELNHSVVGRLKDGRSIEDARAELLVLARRIRDSYPAVRNGPSLDLRATPLEEEIAGRMERPLLLLLAAVGLVLLVTCANVANLVLSRAAARSREIAVRTALGSSRARLLQLLLAEAAILSAAGALLGVLLSRMAVSAVPAVVTEALPIVRDVPIDIRVLTFTTVVAIATSILFALIPLVAVERRAPATALQEEASRTTSGTRRHRLQAGLVVCTVILAFVLLVGAGLFTRSFSALMAQDAGFSADRVLTASLMLPRAGYQNAASVRAFHNTLLTQTSSLAGVRSAALVTDLPLERYERRGVSAEGVDEATVSPNTNLSWVYGPYFETLGIRVTSGRAFSDVENVEARSVVIVNERLARMFWPGQDAVGKRLRWGRGPQNQNAWLTVVGVIADVVDGPLDAEPFIHAYEPFSQFPDFILNSIPTTFGRTVKLAVRTNGDPLALASAVRSQIGTIDRQLAIASIATMEDRVSDVVAPRRFSVMTLGAFAGGSLLLAAIGLYGLLAFTIRERRREIAIRLALGAEPRRILHMVVAQGLTLVSVGLLMGVVVSYAVARAVASLLYQTESHDLITFATVPIVLVLITLVACAMPAYRASRVEPLAALRAE